MKYLKFNGQKVIKMEELQVGRRLKNIREARNLTRRDVEDSTFGEFKESILAMYENGHRRIPTPRLKQLADFYNVTVGFLVGETATPANANVEALLMADPLYSSDEKKLILDVIDIIKAKRKLEGR